MDIFTAITVNFRILSCLFLIRHDRREIIHWNVTERPTGEWVVQQLREAFPENTDKQYLIFRSRREVQLRGLHCEFLDSAQHRCRPHQLPQPMAEQSCRKVGPKLPATICSTRVIVLNEAHFTRLARDYLRYYHADPSTHDGLGKDTPRGRPPSIERILVSDSHHILVWEVCTIAIPGKKLLKSGIVATYSANRATPQRDEDSRFIVLQKSARIELFSPLGGLTGCNNRSLADSLSD